MTGQQRPNLLFIMTDDQGPWTFSGEGHPNAHTPVLDRLAAEGARFERMFANAAICSPSRGTLLTGRYPTEAGFGPDGNVWIADEARHIDPSLPTWPQSLQAAGYRTALIGKWHCGHTDDAYAPQQGGYERFAGWPIGGKRSKDPCLMIDGEWREFKGAYTSDILADLAIDTIRAWGESPFAVSLHFWAPHANQGVPESFALPYDDRTWLPLKDEDLAPWRDCRLTFPNPEFPNLDIGRIDRMMREYYASVHSVDRNVGRVLDVLDELGLADHTIVVFTSDQGYNMGHNGIWHKGWGWWITRDRKDPFGVYEGDRQNLYDHSMRVPAIVRWPARIAPGTVVAQVASFVDWFPTVLDMTRTPMPDGAQCRGRSLLPLLEGRTPDGWSGDVFGQHETLRCYRTPEWKFVRNPRSGEPDELYDLVADPGEHVNRIDDTADPTAKRMRDELEQNLLRVMRMIDDPVLSRRSAPVSA